MFPVEASTLFWKTHNVHILSSCSWPPTLRKKPAHQKLQKCYDWMAQLVERWIPKSKDRGFKSHSSRSFRASTTHPTWRNTYLWWLHSIFAHIEQCGIQSHSLMIYELQKFCKYLLFTMGCSKFQRLNKQLDNSSKNKHIFLLLPVRWFNPSARHTWKCVSKPVPRVDPSLVRK